MKRLTLILASSITLVISVILATYSFMTILSSETNVKIKHSCIKINNYIIAVTFTLFSPKEGKYHYIVSYNSSESPFFWSSDGNIWAGGSFTYVLYLKPEHNKTLAVNVKVLWEGKLIDEVTHYVKAEGD